ncbi:YadA family autotransporter adhesin [Variovorax sp. TBS-050B]|uniref:YadA family autotransporter adhesin n=1 Tax=Variovorax sp. TBS-050B TaxID=2940551 RepID=UPI002474851A|nr:YadA family autotransporter adhesin [Variovorax sp. TBS-050B]
MGTASAAIAGVTHNFAGATPGSTVSVGSAGSERTVTNLAAGRLSAASTDAVNGSQLFAANEEITAVDTRVDTLGAGTASHLGTGATYDAATGTLTGPTYNINGANYNTVKSAVEAAGSGWNLSADGGTTSDNIGPGETANFAAGSNTTVTRNGNTITYGVVSNPTFSGGVTAQSFQVGSTGPSLSATGIDAAGTKITNVAAGTVSSTSTDAVNGSQLFTSNQTISKLGDTVASSLGTGATYDAATGTLTGPTYNINGTNYNTVKSAVEAAGSGWNLSADGGATSDNIGPGETANFAAGSNTTVTRNGNTITYGVVSNPTFSGGVTAQSFQVGSTGPSLSASGIDAAGTKITNVAAGAVSSTSTDAVNGSQLAAVSSVAGAGWNISAQGANATNVGSTSPTGNSVDLNNTDGNIRITKPADSNSVTFGLSDDLSIGNSVSVGGTGGTVVNATGVTTGGGSGPSLTTGGIDAAGRKVTNVAAGTLSSTSTDAVNGSQLFATNSAVENLATTVATSTTRYYSVNDNKVQGGNYANDGAEGANSLAAGVNARAAASEASALGFNANALAAGSVALGSGSVASTAAGVAGYVPPSAGAAQQAAIMATLSTQGAVSVGDVANGVLRQITGVAAGTAASDAVNVAQLQAVANSVSAGGSNKWVSGSQSDAQYVAPSASGTASTAVGSGASVTGNNSVAVGSGAQAATANSVALGNGSTTGVATPTASATILGTTYQFAGAAPVGVVSVGSEGAERQVTNVAAGALSATSTDAVNGSQLYATNQAINNITVGGAGIKYFHANSATADSQAAGAESVAFGPQAIALGAGSLAGGSGAQANGAGSVALGAGAIAAAANGIALGNGATADRGGMAGQRELFSGEAVNSTQGALSVGSAGSERQITNVAGGTQATDAVNVRQLQAVQNQAVKYDTNADGTVNHNSMTLQGAGGTAIHNLADGVAASDAATVNQVNQATAASSAYTDARAGQLRDEIKSNAKDASAGTAGAMAMAGMPQAHIPGKSMLAVAAAGYDGQAALAIGVSKLSESGRWIVKFSGSANSRGKVGVSAGAGFHW